MNDQVETIKKIRFFLVNTIKDLTTEQLNKVPVGFNNNIIWNLAHLTAAFQGVCYSRAGLKPAVDENFIMPFKPGTKPERYFSQDEIETIKRLLFSSLDLFKEDYENNRFANYVGWTTRYGVELSNIDDALLFLQYHEGLHSGYIQALKRLAV